MGIESFVYGIVQVIVKWRIYFRKMFNNKTLRTMESGFEVTLWWELECFRATEHIYKVFFLPLHFSEYDIYGFQTVPEDDDEEKLVAKSRALDLRSLSLSENREISTGVKWENYLASTMNREMIRCVELKNLIRSGIPHEHRSKMWKWCVNLHVKKFKDSAVPGYFQTLLQKALEKPNPASKQIELDLLRTLPNNKHYSSPTSEGIQKLRNVLLAFSWRNPDIGYCQGLNR